MTDDYSGPAFCHWCGPGVPADDTDSYGNSVCHACAMYDDGRGDPDDDGFDENGDPL